MKRDPAHLLVVAQSRRSGRRYAVYVRGEGGWEAAGWPSVEAVREAIPPERLLQLRGAVELRVASATEAEYASWSGLEPGDGELREVRGVYFGGRPPAFVELAVPDAAWEAAAPLAPPLN